MIRIVNETTWDTKELRKLFELVSKNEGYYPRTLYIKYSRAQRVKIGGRATLGPGWVIIKLPHTHYSIDEDKRIKIEVLEGHLIEELAQTYIHELDHNRRIRHKDMIKWWTKDVKYIKGMKIHRMTVKKKPTRTKLKPIIYHGFKIKIYKYPRRIERVHQMTRMYKSKQKYIVKSIPGKETTTYGYYYSFLIYYDGRRVFNDNRIFKENNTELKKYVKDIINRSELRWKK